MTISIETKKSSFMACINVAKLEYALIFPAIAYSSEEPRRQKSKLSKNRCIHIGWLKKCISFSWQKFVPLWAQKD